MVEGLEANRTIREIEHIWQMIYRFGFYRGGPVMMSALSGVGNSLLPVSKLVANGRRLILRCGT